MTLQVNQLIGFGATTSESVASFADCVNVAASGTNNTTGGGYAGYTLITKFGQPELAASGTVSRVTLYGPSVNLLTIGACWIGQATTSGSAYNFDGGQVQVLFSGSASRTLGINEVVVSDDVNFAVSGSRSILVAFQFPASPLTANVYRKTGLSANYVGYEAASVQEAGTTAKVGSYTPFSGRAFVCFRLEVA